MAAPRFPSQIKRARAFGARVRELREDRGWSLKQLSDRADISESQLSRIQTGGSGPPPDEVIAQLAKAFGVDLLGLMHIAGRAVDPEAFQEIVLARLARMAEDQRTGFERVEAALAALVPPAPE